MAEQVTYTPLYSHQFGIRVIPSDPAKKSLDIDHFYSIKGLGMPAAQSTEAYSPGGYDKTYHLPSTAREGTLVLRRPALAKSDLTEWCEENLRTQTFVPMNAYVIHTPSASLFDTWYLSGVYPKGLDYSTLGKGIEYGSTGRGEEAYGILEEIVTLGYNHLERVV